MACQEAAAIWQHNRNYMSLQSTIAQRMQRGTYRCVQVKGIARIQITSAPARIHYWQADRQKITTLWRPPDRSNGNAEGQQCAAKGKEWGGRKRGGKGKSPVDCVYVSKGLHDNSSDSSGDGKDG